MCIVEVCSNMIESKKQLNETLCFEKNLYFNNSFFCWLRKKITLDEEYVIYKYIKYLRISDYYFKKNWILHSIYRRKKNIWGERTGISISRDNIGKGLRIWHYGSIIINGNAKIGENCQLHGNNCIGNKGLMRDDEVPTIGNNVDIGVGAVVLGKVYVADDIKIGANAVVTKSFYEKGITIAGIPAVKISD